MDNEERSEGTKMSRLFGMISAVLLTSLLASGCSSSSTTTKQPTEPKTSSATQPIKVTSTTQPSDTTSFCTALAHFGGEMSMISQKIPTGSTMLAAVATGRSELATIQTKAPSSIRPEVEQLVALWSPALSAMSVFASQPTKANFSKMASVQFKALNYSDTTGAGIIKWQMSNCAHAHPWTATLSGM